VIPVVSLALGVAILNETVSAWALGGVALVLAGSMLAGRAER
jgi:drug/metabolite transporter (DMT)-like permease